MTEADQPRMDNPRLSEPSTELAELLQRVQRSLEMNQEEAEHVTRSTLQTLGSAISGGQSQQLAAWLPPELAPELSDRTGQARSFDLNDFLDKVAQQSRTVDRDVAERYARAVLSALRAAEPGSEIEDTLAQLPPELGDLF